MAGWFIAFEGLDGSGKSTIAKRVTERLRASGKDVVLTREPGGTLIGQAIRKLILESGQTADPVTELMLMCADRAEHVHSVIRPGIDRGAVVLTDRYAASTRAYQGYGLEMNFDTVEAAIAVATGGLEPDLNLLFDIDPETAIARRSGDAGNINMLDLRDFGFRCRVREGFLSLARNSSNWRVVDASMNVDDVTTTTLAYIDELLSRPVASL